MKKFSQFLAIAIILFISVNLQAQTNTGAEYFTGKWNVLLKGTPSGDVKMFIVLTKTDTALAGVVQDSTGAEVSKIDKIQVSGDTATVYFNAQGYDVNLAMTKKDEDHITANMMGMFDAEGERVQQ